MTTLVHRCHDWLVNVSIHNLPEVTENFTAEIVSIKYYTAHGDTLQFPSFNINKCVVLQFKHSINANFDTSYHIDNRELSKVTAHSDLGVIFTENLSWHSHYEAIISNTYKTLGLLKWTFKPTTSPQVKRTLYEPIALVRPKLLYCFLYGDLI